MLVVNIKWHFFWLYIGGKEIDLWSSLTYWDPVLLTGLRLMSIWILAYHLYHYYQNKIETTQQNAKLLVIAKQAQLDNLSAQLNPHFLFNSLNSIKSLVIENPDTARRAIDLLSDILRSSLYEKDKDLIPIKDELALVKDYIELEKMRFEERLQLEVTFDKTLENFKIPTLSIQLLVENAIKHGIDSKIEGGIISVIITMEGGYVAIQVINPGTLSLNKTAKGLGLKNLQERLKLQYKSLASFGLGALHKDRVEAKILIPFTADENI
jgi:LytS/YehU family sensor histidine kinase